MKRMFNECENLEYINLSLFDKTNVVDMSYMFNECYNLSNLNLLNFNTKNVLDKTLMFGDCINLQKIDLSSFITKKNEDMSELFKTSEKNDILDLSHFNKRKNLKGLNRNKLKDEYKIIFVGESGTGAKTSLINRLVGIEFKYDLLSTISPSYTDLKIKLKMNKVITLHLWDTIGQEKYRSLTKLFMRDLDCIVIGYDITRKESFEEAKGFWYNMVKKENLCDLIYFIANKIDLWLLRQVEIEEIIEFVEKENVRFFGISCKTDEGIKEFKDDLIHNLIKQ